MSHKGLSKPLKTYQHLIQKPKATALNIKQMILNTKILCVIANKMPLKTKIPTPVTKR